MLAHWVPLAIVAVALVLFVALYRLTFRLFGVVVVPENGLGIVNKKFNLYGANKALPDGKLVALKGEAGLQADTLAPGLHWGYYPWQYSVTITAFTTIKQGKVGVVEARDGISIPAGRVLAKTVDCDSFQNARAFLEKGGERGPQMGIIPPGTYRINTSLFHVTEEDALEIEDNMVGIVTTKEGAPLPTGEIAGKEITGHNMFQNGQAFLDKGGFKGLQEQVMLAGLYYVNPLFVEVEEKPMTEVPIAHAGVVISFVGDAGVDVTGVTFKHGNLVSKGQKGVCVEPLDPGKYPINPYTHRVENVPTANVVLNWATGKTESHKLDEKLSTITVRSSDGFKFNLDVSQIIHIPRTDAPKVIARFGSVANLVTQVLEPTIGNYFRNAAQSSDVIGFLTQRSQRQDDARKAIATALAEYNVGAVDTLIGDINPPEDLMKTLTDRKIAASQQITFGTQRLAEEERKQLEQARAQAATQAGVVTAQRSVEIAAFTAEASVKKAEGDARAKTLNAEADAMVLRTVGEGEASKVKAVGEAEAAVIRLKIESVEAGNYATIEVAKALAGSGKPLVPEIVAGGSGADGGGNSIVNILIAGLVRESMRKNHSSTPHADILPGDPGTESAASSK